MSIITQLPTMYLRGSLATQTMAKLSPEQQELAAKTFEFVANHPEMQKHKRKYIRQINDTIGGDYRDPDAAEQDYLVVIWRGVVMLYFHKEYEYECMKCSSRTYRNQSGTVSEIRRQTETCPNCGESGDNGESPIRSFVVGDRHVDPESVITDENQMSKWFSRQLTNAIRQQLRENPITTTTTTNVITDSADTQIHRSIINMLNSNKIAHQSVSTQQGSNIIHNVYFDTLACSAKIIGHLSIIRNEAAENGVILTTDSAGVKIERGDVCGTITQTVVEKVHVTMLLPSQSKPDAVSPLDISIGRGDIQKSISNDFLEEFYDCLPSENCKAACQIIQQEGEWHDKYIAKYGDVKWTFKNIEIFLDVSKKEMSVIREQIKAVMIAMIDHDID